MLTLAPGFFASPVLAVEAPTPAPQVTAPQMLDAFEGTFGVHPGQPDSCSDVRYGLLARY